MDGDEIRADFTVTEDGAAPAPTGEKAEALAGASAEYLSYVRDEVATLIDKTQAFADAFEAGDDDTARSLYADARVHWERIEPIAESFGDLDPLLDLREADLGPQELWTGWHHAEKVLWPPSEGYVVTDAERTALAEGLVENTLELERRVTDEAFVIEAFQVGNGAKELLDEVATSKITGEEEIWSGTDLWDMQANIDGALAAYTALRPIVEASDPELVTQLDARFADVNDLLATHGSIAEGFVTYTELSDADVVALSRAIEALSEALARLTAAAVL
jgi:iron uptake system component EfeO